MSKRANKSYSVPALEKGLDLLEALASVPFPITLTDLARILNRSSSVLFRVVASLETRRYIIRDPISGGYRLTLKLFELAHTHSPLEQLLRAAASPMRQLSDLINESCHLAILERGRLVTVAEELSPARVRLSIEVGSQVNPLPFASGRLLTAFLPVEEQEMFLKADSDYQKMNRSARVQFKAELQSIRRAGFTLRESIARTGLDLATIVGNPEIGVRASLAVPFLAGGKNHKQEKQIVPLVQKCAHRITTALGLTPAIFRKAKAG
jgi:DNA-binding IclR family transcriptional regulator